MSIEATLDSCLDKADLTGVAHTLDAGAVAAQLGVDPDARLPTLEAERRLAQAGPNVLLETAGKSRWAIIWEQLAAVIVLVLIAAGVISLVLGKVVDALAIAAIVVLNATLGFQQDYRAERAMAALKKLAPHWSRCGGMADRWPVPAPNVVPGDVLLLEAGDLVPADARLLKSPNLRVQEAALTGESQPVEKAAQISRGGTGRHGGTASCCHRDRIAGPQGWPPQRPPRLAQPARLEVVGSRRSGAGDHQRAGARVRASASPARRRAPRPHNPPTADA